MREFYSTTGAWWGAAEAKVTDHDHRRVALVSTHAGAGPKRILELGSGYGTTARTLAKAGHDVTAVEVSDRAAFSEPFVQDSAPGSLAITQDDFFQVELTDSFDVICYWNGFGVGSDADQRRLLKRIAADWLQADGVVLIDVYNPFVWAGWDGDEEHRMPQPDLGYDYELHERTTFDPVTCVATDTWWCLDDPDHPISQHLRCYTPADLALLLEGTGLALDKIDVDGPLNDHHEYLAILTPTTP